MQTVVIKKGETIQLIAETLESYPVVITWADALNVAAGKIQNDARNAINMAQQAAAIAQQQGTATPVAQPSPDTQLANDAGAGEAGQAAS